IYTLSLHDALPISHCRPCSTTGSSPRNLSRNLSRTAVRRTSERLTGLTSSLQIGQARISRSSASMAIGGEVYHLECGMKLLHIVAGNRWTGAAAPAFAEVAALRQAGVDAHFAYTGGYKLEAKIGHLAFTHPVIPKAQNPFSRSLRRLIEQENFDCVHAHLTYDHWLARLAGVCTMRTFHTHRTLRSDPFTRSLIRHSRLICVTNDALRDARPIRARNPLFTPPPIDLAQFRPEGADVRDRYGIARDALLLAAIGKLSKHRGFELVLQTFALLRKRVGNAHLMIVGHGEHRPELESLARDLGIGRAVTWAGYHEDDLADHYRAAGFLLFTAKGSDEGHRAVLEAMACGT